MRVAIVHYWLVGMRGGEKVVETLCRMFPQADVFTHVYVPDAISDTIRSHTVKTSFINGLPRPAKLYKKYLPLMPMALEQLDLRGYDLIISSESGPAKGIIPPAGALHICYCHSPMRYLWNMFHDYRERSGRLTKYLMPALSHYLRLWDVSAAARVDTFVANSATVAGRIEAYYRRDAQVIHPPVDVDAFFHVEPAALGDFHLMVGELVPYKRPDLAVQAFNRMKRNLVVIGGGEMLDELRRIAGPTVTILGPQPFSVLRDRYAHCQALLFPGEEDFGIVPVEAMASGRPVIALNKGGATETVVDGVTGVLFDEADIEGIIAAVERCSRLAFDSAAIIRHASSFRAEVFEARMKALIDARLADRAKRRKAPSSAHGSIDAREPIAEGVR